MDGGSAQAAPAASPETTSDCEDVAALAAELIDCARYGEADEANQVRALASFVRARVGRVLTYTVL